MHRLVEFIRSVYVIVLFVLLEVVAVGYYARSNCYTQARLLVQSNSVAGGVHGFFAGVRHYFNLGRENRELLSYIKELEERLAKYDEAATRERLDGYLKEIGEPKYRISVATVVGNSINRSQNYLTLNRGMGDGVTSGMAVLAADGSMVGYVVDCTERYAVAMSVLNTSFRASGRIADTEYFGSIYWDGRDPHVVTLGELSKYADPQPGQEVVTIEDSIHFPGDILIGTVESAELNVTKTAYTVRVRLAAELTALTDVILVSNSDLYEIQNLQQSEQVQQHTRPE